MARTIEKWLTEHGYGVADANVHESSKRPPSSRPGTVRLSALPCEAEDVIAELREQLAHAQRGWAEALSALAAMVNQ